MGVAQSVGSLSRVLGPLLGRGAVRRARPQQPVLLRERCWSAAAAAGRAGACRGRGAAGWPHRRPANEPAPMSPRGRMPPLGAGRDPKGRLSRRAARAEGADALSVAARLARSCGCGSCWRWRCSARRQARSTSASRFSTSTRSMRSRSPGAPRLIAVPVALIVAYGVARVLSQGFNELRNAVFAKVEQRAVRRVALSAFRHLHALSLRFHLERRTGGLSRAVERGTAGDRFPAVVHAVQRRADPVRDPAGLRDPVAALRLDLRRRHVRRRSSSTSPSPSRSPIGGCAFGAR